MDLAALAALRSPCDIEIGGLLYEVQPVPLQAWIRAALEPHPILPLLDFDAARRLMRRVYDDEVDMDDLVEAWHDALEVFSGLDWWAALRLLQVIADSWSDFAGELVLRGQDALTLPLDAALAAVWTLVKRNTTDDLKLMQLTDQVFKAPPEVAGDEPAPLWTPEDEGAEWLKAAAAQGGRVPSADAPTRIR